MASYVYRPLSSPSTQFRLLELLPGKGTIQCRLKEFNLENFNAKYSPLSYCWGKSPKTHIIQIDGTDFVVADNLHNFLKRFRNRSAEQRVEMPLLWIDAICINQSDIVEKNAQVSIMATIYRGGCQTFVWLGEEKLATNKAFQYLRETASRARQQPEMLLLNVLERQQKESEQGSLRAFSGHKGLNRVWSTISEELTFLALNSIHRRPYFTRTWIVQEIVLSRSIVVLCGRHEISWDDLALGMHWRGKWPQNAFFFLAIDDLRSTTPLARENEPFLEAIMARLSATCATDFRDKIYGMMSLVPENLDVEVDYATSEATLFKDFTARTILKRRKLDVLSMGHGTGFKGLCCGDLEEAPPSWVWDPRPRQSFRVSFPVPGSLYPFHAARSTQCDPRIHQNRLELHGIILDEILIVGQPMYKPRHMMDLSGLLAYVRCYVEWRRIAGMDEEWKVVGQAKKRRVMNIFRRTLNPLSHKHVTAKTGSAEAERVDDEHGFEAIDAEIMRRFGRHIHSNQEGRTDSWPRVKIRDRLRLRLALAEFIVQFWFQDPATLAVFNYSSQANGLWNRRIVRSSSGFVGLCPCDTKPGDSIVLLAGSDVPFVLRPILDRGQTSSWRLVGECYVHEVMYGEAWDDSKCVLI